MKKNCFNKIANIFFLIIAMLFASCSDLSIVDELDDTGTISISVAETNARMVLPALDVEHFTDFELKGTLGSGTQETIKTWSTYSDFTSEKDNVKIKSGNWTFVFTCKKGNENFSGTTTATITSGSSTNLSFELNHTQSGANGAAKITIEWPNNAVRSVVYCFASVAETSATRVFISYDSIQNNKVVIQKDNLAPDTYAIELQLFDINVTEELFADEANHYTLENALVDQIDEVFVVESGLTSEVTHNLKHLKDPVLPGLTANALTDNDGKGYVELKINWPTNLFYSAVENDQQVYKSEHTYNIEVYRNGEKCLNYMDGGQNNPTVTLYDRYDLTQGTEYKYRVVYNWQWGDDVLVEKTVTATAAGLARPPIECPTATVNGNFLTFTDKKESAISAYRNNLPQSEQNDIQYIDMRFEYYDEKQPNDYGSTRIGATFRYADDNDNAYNCWTSANAGQTRKLCAANLRFHIPFGSTEVTREFFIPSNQLQNWAQQANFPTTLQIALSQN